ncbi:family 16 glycosylhydrolase [Ohtaekwangia koreensis]|uniref:Glycosyl hydrolases family 16 n=1 Tax=Ohtaekwangia koreensis TaxID=688867 RepID=A0A1T5MMY7_9BACT|nr:family 16 glycosylhydrolase [Ohtaekwangia koreensis]SKC89562.1 Glycosyl hydrolases family 16 [Ohtaekwangia koreensis]
MIKRLKASFTYILIAMVVCMGCGGDNEDQQLTLPSNLQVSVTVSDNGSGLVSVAASATNVNFYTIYFGESTSETPLKVTDGKATHTYASSGTYTVLVQAHVTNSDFVSQTKQVTVVVGSNSGEVIIPTTGYSTPETYNGMTLVWRDEFDGATLNTTDWTHEIGNGTNGWGNNELQYYRPENTTVKDGHLIITAKKESFQGSNYTSSRIITNGKKTFKYGRVDIRAALPKGQGIWPALWMLGENINTVSWPKCGEIDIMELVGGTGKDNTVYGTVHWDEGGNHADYGKSYKLSSGIFNDQFHVFSIVWTASKITWYVDDVQFNVIDTTPAGLSEFQEKFFFIFNVAVGGKWPGNPDASTSFPQHMVVDYIRIFQ